MIRFICVSNIGKFEQVLQTETDIIVRARVEDLLASERRTLALLDSAEFGTRDPLHRPPPPSGRLSPADEQDLREAIRHSPLPTIMLDPGPGLRMVDANPAVESLTGLLRDDLLGQPFFDVFPDNTSRPRADGVTRLSESLRMAARTGEPHTMAPQRYDLPDAQGVYQPRYWIPTNTPILDEEGRLAFLVHESRETSPPGEAPSL